MTDKIYMTQQGYDSAKKRLSILETEKRSEISERIKTAREFGDLSENAEYDAAKNEQAMIEGEIHKLRENLKLAHIIVESENKDAVNLGCKVQVYDADFDEQAEYEIVGTAEADPRANRISNESPYGRSLMGKKVGEIAEVSAPQGTIRLKILKIS